MFFQFILYLFIIKTNCDFFVTLYIKIITIDSDFRESGEHERCATHPPIAVLLSQDHEYLSLREAQLIVVVGLAVVQCLNPTGCRTARLKGH